MTPQQKALLAELRAAEYPATWKLSSSAADDKLVAGGHCGCSNVVGTSLLIQRQQVGSHDVGGP